jgi:hypothetical protein
MDRNIYNVEGRQRARLSHANNPHASSKGAARSQETQVCLERLMANTINPRMRMKARAHSAARTPAAGSPGKLGRLSLELEDPLAAAGCPTMRATTTIRPVGNHEEFEVTRVSQLRP